MTSSRGVEFQVGQCGVLAAPSRAFRSLSGHLGSFSVSVLPVLDFLGVWGTGGLCDVGGQIQAPEVFFVYIMKSPAQCLSGNHGRLQHPRFQWGWRAGCIMQAVAFFPHDLAPSSARRGCVSTLYVFFCSGGRKTEAHRGIKTIEVMGYVPGQESRHPFILANN